MRPNRVDLFVPGWSSQRGPTARLCGHGVAEVDVVALAKVADVLHLGPGALRAAQDSEGKKEMGAQGYEFALVQQ